MLRAALSSLALFLTILCISAQNSRTVIDSASGEPLAGATVFDHQGNYIGVTASNGRLPHIAKSQYPITVRLMGFNESVVTRDDNDTIFLAENPAELPEVIVDSRDHTVMHALGYVREYSTISSYTDTIQLFREKMVDFMIPMKHAKKFAGWRMPRVLKTNSYYRFTNKEGLDSVSDKCSHFFSWADWIGLLPTVTLPSRLHGQVAVRDTVMGLYSPAEIWQRNDDQVKLYVNILADRSMNKWSPRVANSFRDEIEFDQFRLFYNFDNVDGDSISPLDLTNYSFIIESTGRGEGIYLFNRAGDKYFVSTYAEVYLIDKEFITEKEARKWEDNKYSSSALAMYIPDDAPELQPATLRLIDRVNNIDINSVRVGLQPDQRLKVERQDRNLGQRVLNRIKGIFGIDQIRGNQKRKNEWKQFRRNQHNRNSQSLHQL